MGSTRCRICRHVERVSIENACTSRSLADVAESFALSESSLERHITQHPTADVPSGVRAIAMADDDDAPVTLRSPGQVAA